MFAPVISISHLDKIYRSGFQALKDVSLDIRGGEIFSLLGPNGAGKTTLINIIAGLVIKTSGSVLVLGKDVEKDYRFTRSRIGLVQQEIAFDPFLSVIETLRLQAGYFGIANAEPRIDELLKELRLDGKRNAVGRSLSGGMKRRVMIAKALVHDPEVVFLDEPTAGVDVDLRENLWSLVGKMKEMGKTIILTTHYLEEAEAMAQRIAIINQGKILFVEEKEKLLNDHGTSLADIYRKYVHQEETV